LPKDLKSASEEKEAMSEHPELICAYRLDNTSRSEALDWPKIVSWTPNEGAIWVHLDAGHEDTEAWLREASGLDSFIVDGLLAEETRPRCDWYEDGTLLILRGVNLNPGAEPEDMVSIRIWIDEQRIISTRLQQLMAVEDLRKELTVGKGPRSTGQLVARLVANLTERMGPVIEDLSGQIDGLEDQLIRASGEGQSSLRDMRGQLIELRSIAIHLRRYIAPQRDALNRLSQLDEDWLDKRSRGQIRETVDRVTRITEELDEVRERSAVVQDELLSRISQRMERTMYILTVVATIMLPLGFITGLLGINVDGIPGEETPWAFWAVCVSLVALVVLEVVCFRRLKWF
jgi:zinc transporter